MRTPAWAFVLLILERAAKALFIETHTFAPEPVFRGCVRTKNKKTSLKQHFKEVFRYFVLFVLDLERKTRLELATPTLARLCSTN